MLIQSIYHGEELRKYADKKIIIWGNGYCGKKLRGQLEYRDNVFIYDNVPSEGCICEDKLKSIVQNEPALVVIAIRKKEVVYQVYKQLSDMCGDVSDITYRYIDMLCCDEAEERKQEGYFDGINKVKPYSVEDAVELVKGSIKDTKPFLLSRWGIVEGGTVFNVTSGIELCENNFQVLKTNAGFFGPLNEAGIAGFVNEYERAAKEIDILNAWFWFSVEERLFLRYSPGAKLVTSAMSYPFFEQTAWTEALRGMKVLVIHPWAELIEKQYLKREVLFKCDKVLPPFELQTYKAVQSMGGCAEYSSWLEALDQMKRDIAGLEFDIALIGCGAYGMPLGAFIKRELQKKAIHMGGSLQILFGIKGKRWEGAEGYNYDERLYNEHWVRPTDDLKPRVYKEVEGGCYW